MCNLRAHGFDVPSNNWTLEEKDGQIDIELPLIFRLFIVTYLQTQVTNPLFFYNNYLIYMSVIDRKCIESFYTIVDVKLLLIRIFIVNYLKAQWANPLFFYSNSLKYIGVIDRKGIGILIHHHGRLRNRNKSFFYNLNQYVAGKHQFRNSNNSFCDDTE